MRETAERYGGDLPEASWFLKYRTYVDDAVAGAKTKEVVYMERPIDPKMGPSLADVLLCTFESTNAGFSSFPVSKLLS
jgi:hypothetical protein